MLLYTFYFYRPFFLLILPSPPSSTLFPYTTLFRSYLKHVISNIVTLRRYDQSRPVALYCSENHLDLIQQSGLEHYFQALNILPEEKRAVIGFMHNIYKFMPFEENWLLDSDILLFSTPDTV